MANNYNVPLGIDSQQIFRDFNLIDEGLENMGQTATVANKQMQTAFDQTAQAAGKLEQNIQADGRAIQVLRDQAAKFGTDIATSLSGKGVSDQFKTRIDEMKRKLATLTTTAVDVSINFDSKKIDSLKSQITAATSAQEEFNAVIGFAKQQLEGLEPGSQQFVTLSTQIATAEEFLQRLNATVANTIPNAAILTQEFERIFGNPGAFLTEAELTNLDAKIIESTTDAGALTAQVQALAAKLGTLEPGSAKFTMFQEAVTAGNNALAAMGAELVEFTTAEGATEGRTQTLVRQLRAMTQELAVMEQNGQQNTVQFRQLAERAGELSDQIGDTRQRIRAFASDTKYLDAGISAFTGLVGAATAAQGAVALLGGENEKAQKIIQKVTGAMAILQGVQAVANTLNKDSAFSVIFLSQARAVDATTATAEAAATTAVAVAAGEAAIATEAEAAATVEATAAAVGFNAALLLNPVVLVTAALLLGVTALIQYASASTEAEEAQIKLNSALTNQKIELDNNLKDVQNYTNRRVALANLRGAKESEISGIEREGLGKQKKAQEDYLQFLIGEQNKLQKLRDADNISEEDFYKESEKINAQRLTTSGAIYDLMGQVDTNAVKQRGQANKELIQLAQALTQEESANYNERKKIVALYLAGVKGVRDEQLKLMADGSEKEKRKLINDNNDRIATIRQNNKDYQQTIKENNNKISLLSQQAAIGEVDPAVAAKQIEDLRGQNSQYAGVIKQSGAQIAAIRKSQVAELAKIDKEAAQKRLELQLAANLELAQAEREGLERDLDVLKAQYQQRANQITVQYKNEKVLRDKLLAANTADYNRKEAQLRYDARLKAIDQDSELDQLALQNSGLYATNRTKQQKALQIELLRIQLEYAEKRLAALVDDGTKESQIAIAQQKKLINDLKKGIQDGVKSADTFDIFDLFGLGGESDETKRALTEATTQIMNSLKTLTDFTVAQYTRQIDAKQELIDATQDQIDDLEDQLDREKDLQADGLANNVNNIQAQLEAKKKQKDEEIKQQNDLLKQRAAQQRAQLAIDTAAEASGLIVSAVNIFKSFSTIPFGLGIPLAIATVALMTGAFAAAKVQAFQAVNDASQQANAKFEKGGWIDGKPHSQGGQKYRSVDGTGGTIELQGGEFVVNDQAAAKHAEFLEALNSNYVSDADLANFLKGFGIRLSEATPEAGLASYSQREVAQANVVNYNSAPVDNDSLQQMSGYLKYLAAQKKMQPVTWEDSQGTHTRIGNKVKIILKK
jgi:hypothetical protein